MLSSLALGSSLLLSPAIRLPHEYDLQNYKFDVTLDFVTESISGTVVNTLVTTKDNAALAFDKGPMSIKSVTIAGIKTYKTKVTGDNIVVNLTNVKKGKALTVTIKYDAAPEAGIYFVNAKRAYPDQSLA